MNELEIGKKYWLVYRENYRINIKREVFGGTVNESSGTKYIFNRTDAAEFGKNKFEEHEIFDQFDAAFSIAKQMMREIDDSPKVENVKANEKPVN